MTEKKAEYKVDRPPGSGSSPPVCKVYLKRINDMGRSEVEKETSTTTPSVAAALVAFRELRARKDLEGHQVHLVFSKNNQHVLYHRFDVEPGHDDYVDEARIVAVEKCL